MRRALYNEAVTAAKADGEITGTDAHELAKIQKFLALRDDQVEKTKWDLQRLRTLTEIRRGNLPEVPSNSSSLRGAQLEPEETAHYSMSVEVLDLPTTRQNDGVRAEWAKPYEQGTAKMHVLPEDGAKPQGDASLVLTNRRLVIRLENGKIAAIRYGPQAQIFLYSDGVRLERTVGNTVLRFKSKSEDTCEIVGGAARRPDEVVIRGQTPSADGGLVRASASVPYLLCAAMVAWMRSSGFGTISSA